MLLNVISKFDREVSCLETTFGLLLLNWRVMEVLPFVALWIWHAVQNLYQDICRAVIIISNWYIVFVGICLLTCGTSN